MGATGREERAPCKGLPGTGGHWAAPRRRGAWGTHARSTAVHALRRTSPAPVPDLAGHSRLQLDQVVPARCGRLARTLELLAKVGRIEAQVVLRDHRDGRASLHDVLPRARVGDGQADGTLGQVVDGRPCAQLCSRDRSLPVRRMDERLRQRGVERRAVDPVDAAGLRPEEVWLRGGEVVQARRL
eukprot:4268058-Prymnesium_polylepis.1